MSNGSCRADIGEAPERPSGKNILGSSYSMLVDYVSGLEEENARLSEKVHDLEVERDHAIDCVKDILATAKDFGFDQNQGAASCDSMRVKINELEWLATYMRTNCWMNAETSRTVREKLEELGLE